MSQATSISTSGPISFAGVGVTDGSGTPGDTFKIVAVVVAALLLAFLVFRKSK